MNPLFHFYNFDALRPVSSNKRASGAAGETHMSAERHTIKSGLM
jgi:hypothetical protein